MSRLSGEDQALDLTLVVLGIEDHQLVPVRRDREVADASAGMEVVLLTPHALELRREALLAVMALDDLTPLLALLAAPAPMQLEEDVAVEVRVDVVEVHLDLARPPEGRLGNGDIGARGGSNAGVRRRRTGVDLLALGAQVLRLSPDLLDQRRAPLGVDQLVHRVESYEGVLAVEDARLVDLIRVLAARVEDPAAEVAIDRRAADQDR